MVREFFNAAVSRSALDRRLRRHDVSDLEGLQPELEGQAWPRKKFKDYESGCLHVDVKYLLKMPDETPRRCLLVVIDRATRWVFIRIYREQSNRLPGATKSPLGIGCWF